MPPIRTITYLQFCDMVALLALTYQATVVSWWRTAERNKLVGGLPTSNHLDGYAVDLVCDRNIDKNRLLVHARRLGLDAIDEGNHIHIEADRRTRPATGAPPI